MPRRIGIALGDPTGIGPEVVLKALALEQDANVRYLLLGDVPQLQELNRRLKLGLPLQVFRQWDEPGQFHIFNPLSSPLPASMKPGEKLAALAALTWLTEGAQRALDHELDALVTAPVNKAAMINAGVPFVGQTEYLSSLAKAQRTAMMLLGYDDRGRWLRVALVTTHVAIKDVSDQLHQAKIQQVIELAAEACQRLRLGRARVGVCGLNPHAGEGGKLGTEELLMIGPAVETARHGGVDATGPLPADSLFYQAFRGEFDAVVAMYHDQGLAPLKMIGFNTGVNWTLIRPLPRLPTLPAARSSNGKYSVRFRPERLWCASRARSRAR